MFNEKTRVLTSIAVIEKQLVSIDLLHNGTSSFLSTFIDPNSATSMEFVALTVFNSSLGIQLVEDLDLPELLDIPISIQKDNVIPQN